MCVNVGEVGYAGPAINLTLHKLYIVLDMQYDKDHNNIKLVKVVDDTGLIVFYLVERFKKMTDIATENILELNQLMNI